MCRALRRQPGHRVGVHGAAAELGEVVEVLLQDPRPDAQAEPHDELDDQPCAAPALRGGMAPRAARGTASVAGVGSRLGHQWGIGSRVGPELRSSSAFSSCRLLLLVHLGVTGATRRRGGLPVGTTGPFLLSYRRWGIGGMTGGRTPSTSRN